MLRNHRDCYQCGTKITRAVGPRVFLINVGISADADSADREWFARNCDGQVPPDKIAVTIQVATCRRCARHNGVNPHAREIYEWGSLAYPFSSESYALNVARVLRAGEVSYRSHAIRGAR